MANKQNQNKGNQTLKNQAAAQGLADAKLMENAAKKEPQEDPAAKAAEANKAAGVDPAEQAKIDAAAENLAAEGVNVAAPGVAVVEGAETPAQPELSETAKESIGLDANATTQVTDGSVKQIVKDEDAAKAALATPAKTKDGKGKDEKPSNNKTDEAQPASSTVKVHETVTHSGGSQQIVDVKDKAIG